MVKVAMLSNKYLSRYGHMKNLHIIYDRSFKGAPDIDL